MVRKHSGSGRYFLKCGLMKEHHTAGGATDVKARWTACRSWFPKELPKPPMEMGFGSIGYMSADDMRVHADQLEEQGDTKEARIFRSLAETDFPAERVDFDLTKTICEEGGNVLSHSWLGGDLPNESGPPVP